jgi:para-aminobenzoate synthetase/4-amino-4-deoxychorismate lyase
MSRWHAPPAELFAVVEQTPATVLLESAPTLADSAAGSLRPSSAPLRLFTRPLRICVADQLSELPALFGEIEQAVSAGLYAAGYFSYECAAYFEPTVFTQYTPQSIAASGPWSHHPLAWFGIYAPPYLFDYQSGTFVGTEPPAVTRFGKEAQAELSTEPPCPIAPPCFPRKGTKPGPLTECTLAITEQQYTERIHQIHALISSGDAYQLNFTLDIALRTAGSSAALYSHLRALQPAPYGAFLHTKPHHRILSFSPELFFRIESEGQSRRITTRPMKGTAPRGRTSQEDRQTADWLRNDPKNRSENVMIVDLLRNDLGRLCRFGSVQASDLFAVERYPTLWQMTSTITGDLRPEVDFEQIFGALFPCGSVTGAPKIRAMQLLSELEQQPRGVYTGAIGFFSKEQSVFNVAIRTLALEQERGVMGVGSGIVIDSNPADEWRECLLKAQFLTDQGGPAARPAPGSFSLIETLLWNGEYPLLDLHLDRLEDSANYFAFPFNRATARASLNQPNTKGAPGPGFETGESTTPRKVRLLLHPDGSLQITSEPIPASTREPLRVRICPSRIDPADPMYFHKTTHRPLYAEALKEAHGAGFDEVLFFNLGNELTESAIHNVFIQKAGRLLTPPIACGLLPGVHRRHILASDPNAAEQILMLEDLRQADAIYLSNAVRGLRPAVIDWE